jgi:hypothetical protein
MHVGVIPERNVLQTDGTFLITNIFSFSTETFSAKTKRFLANNE